MGAALHSQLVRATARYDAIAFALMCKGDVACVKSRIEAITVSLASISSDRPDCSSSDFEQQVYQQAYLAGLQAALEVSSLHPQTLDNRYPATPPHLQGIPLSLLNLVYPVEGKMQAFQFALDSEGDVMCLNSEIQAVEAMITQGLSRNPTGPMTPAASPRKVKDGYLAGLREAVELVSSLFSDGDSRD